jgi:uncharacterized protein with ATP-grasp and redox domains
MDFVFGENIFDELEVQKMIAKFSNKWVFHLKAVGVLENKDRENEVWEWYEDKTELDVLTALMNSDPDSREVYVLMDNLSEATFAYETWFPKEIDLSEEERHLYVKITVTSPDQSYYFTNEKPEEKPAE